MLPICFANRKRRNAEAFQICQLVAPIAKVFPAESRIDAEDLKREAVSNLPIEFSKENPIASYYD